MLSIKGSFNILIVDDSRVDRLVYQKFISKNLEHIDINFLEAERIDEAQKILEESTVNCILLDYILPDGNGTELLTKIHHDEKFKFIPVIMLTGKGDEEVAVCAMKEGAMDYLLKNNLSAPALVSSVSNAIEKCI